MLGHACVSIPAPMVCRTILKIWGVMDHIGGQPKQFGHSIQNIGENKAREKKMKREKGKEGDGKANGGLSRPPRLPRLRGPSCERD